MSVSTPSSDVAAERGFGMLFAFVFGIVALWPLLDREPPRIAWLLAALGITVVAIVAPRWLGPFSRLWRKIGHAMASVMNPLWLGILFYGVVTPVGLLRRLFVRDPLHLRPDADATSYWVPRKSPRIDPESFEKLF
jgi:hypothetical protein